MFNSLHFEVDTRLILGVVNPIGSVSGRLSPPCPSGRSPGFMVTPVPARRFEGRSDRRIPRRLAVELSCPDQSVPKEMTFILNVSLRGCTRRHGAALAAWDSRADYFSTGLDSNSRKGRLLSAHTKRRLRCGARGSFSEPSSFMRLGSGLLTLGGLLVLARKRLLNSGVCQKTRLARLNIRRNQ